MKAIDIEVYRNSRNKGCANGGISERFDELLIACEGGNLDIKGDEENLVHVVHRVIYGRDVWHLAPMDSDKKHYMFGGNFGYSCDSRFNELHGICGALAIHDRREVY